ncbi:dopamine receptor D2a isoform X2 [Brachyhypopomus gauderio]|uniref:dopamine receptor D2a isoform X2 n=1 Tax=Brachyhypopomus gauderio TaxID=698409 RepID=UPI004041BCBA
MDVLGEHAQNESVLETGLFSLNGTDSGGGRHQYNYYAMLLTLLIFVIVFGNVLVCMAVSREKALQTTTNYLIVSLALADLLVATLVMPWVVYLEVVGEWRFSTIHCDIFVTLDVMMCTASILNLCAISIDRYTAVAMPMLYNTHYSSKRRVTLMISVVWILSFAISCPLLFGLNNTESRDDSMCVIANPAFVVYSSIVSFYVPFIITLLVYVQIYVVLRKRRKRVSTKRTCPGSAAVPALKIFTKEVANNGEVSQVEEVLKATPAKQKQLEDLDCKRHDLPLDSNHSETDVPLPGPEISLKLGRNGSTFHTSKMAKAFETQVSPSGKMQTSVKSFNIRKISQQKEKKATQMLAIVLGVFIICWLPFFITHIVNTYCHVPVELYTAFTWLGYVNSAVNPIIYTTFNIEFRKAFIKILHC